jgi:hydroxyacid-oxoacid transhydrogenase
VPHGVSVVLNAPAVFRFTARANPSRHLHAASLLGAETGGASPDDAGEILATTIIDLMRRTGIPDGLAALGYSEADVAALTEATLPQHRVTKLSPRPAEREDLEALFRSALHNW